MAVSPEDVLHELTWVRGYFPEDAIRAAVALGSGIAPQLIAGVKEAVRAPYDVSSSNVLHLCAMFVLAQNREREAYKPLVELCRLPDDEIDRLLGAVFTEGLPQVLASVAHDDDSLLRGLIADKKVCEFARMAALHAMACGAVVGSLDQGRFTDYMADLLRGAVVDRKPHLLWDEAACIVTDMGLVHLLPAVLQAFDDGLMQARVIGRQEVVDHLSVVREPFTPRGPERYCRVDDAVAELRRWRSMWEDWDELDEATMQAMEPFRRPVKVGRNDACPCGSGKKYKKCCGQMGSGTAV